MKEVEILYNILTKEELEYITELIKDESKWVWRTNYDDVNSNGEKLWYDSIIPEYDRLKDYHKLICEEGNYVVVETAINIISKDRQNIDNMHVDSSDLSYSTYFNNDFKGGRFFYYDEDKKKHSVEPKAGLTVRINTGVKHSVEEVFDGIRYSLYTFLRYKPKKTKSLI